MSLPSTMRDGAVVWEMIRQVVEILLVGRARCAGNWDAICWSIVKLQRADLDVADGP